jgi:Rrf2 family cysteine metabolism transcriptional repressor
MRISQKAEYALRAMLDLSLNGGLDEPQRSSTIADRARIPEKFLEAILVDLRKAGLVNSRRGPEGGHQLARPPARISVRDIVKAIDGPLELAGQGRKRPPSADPSDEILNEMWSEVEAKVRAALEEVTVEELHRRVEARRGVIDFSI